MFPFKSIGGSLALEGSMRYLTVSRIVVWDDGNDAMQNLLSFIKNEHRARKVNSCNTFPHQYSFCCIYSFDVEFISRSLFTMHFIGLKNLNRHVFLYMILEWADIRNYQQLVACDVFMGLNVVVIFMYFFCIGKFPLYCWQNFLFHSSQNI